MIISITGHRPDKLPNKETGYKLPNPTYIKVCQEMEKIFLELKPEKVITGMALGSDQYAAFVCLKLKIPFVAAIPFPNQELKWPSQSQIDYRKLLKAASEQVIVSPPPYKASKLHARNKWMVDHSDLLLACFIPTETEGGTYNCIQYAKGVGRDIIYIDPTIK